MSKRQNVKSKRGKTGGKSQIGDYREQIKTIRGHQNYTNIQNGANGTQMFNVTNAIPLSPDSLGTQVADLANHFNQYRFLKIGIEFMPSRYVFRGADADTANTELRNLFAFGYEDDGVPTFTVTFDNISTLQHQLITPVSGWPSRKQNTLQINIGKKGRWYYTKDALSTDPAIRQTVQGIIYGEARSSISDATDYGKMQVHYEIQFKDLCPTQSVTLAALVKEAQLARTDVLTKLVSMLKHAGLLAKFKGQLPPDMLAKYTNEECHMFGIDRPLVVHSWPDNCDEYLNMLGGVLAEVDDFSAESCPLPRAPSYEVVPNFIPPPVCSCNSKPSG